MKKIVMILAIALATFSCSTEDAATQVQAKTVDVAMNVNGEVASSSNTAKQVKQGNIPASVKLIKVTSLKDGVTKTYEQFDLVPNTQSGITSNFILNDVPVGTSTFTAVTETAATEYFVVAPEGGKTAEEIINTYKAHIPWALYWSQLLNKSISGTSLNVLDFNMTTQNGRIITVFQLDDDANLKANYRYSIKAEIKNSANAVLETKSATRIENDSKVYFEWSKANAIAGNKVVYTVDVIEKGNDNNKKSYTLEQSIKASTSIHCIYTITSDRAPVLTPVSNQPITFTWQQWLDENCPDYPNCK